MLERNFHGSVLISGWELALWTERMGPWVCTQIHWSGKSLQLLPMRPGIQGSPRVCGPLYHLQLVTTICDETQHLA